MLDLVEASWEPTWEPEARLLEYEPHLRLVQEYKADLLTWYAITVVGA